MGGHKYNQNAVRSVHTIPWQPEVFFLVGGDRIERRSREGESRSGEKKTSGTNG